MKGKLMKVRKKPLAIEYVKTSELVPYAGNAKEHPAYQIEQIKKSILDYGMNDPIAIWHGNEIIEGHGRLIACEELGIEEVPVIRLDDLTDEERREYALVHNKLTMNSGFDELKLDFELSALPEFDMSAFGFDMPVEIEGREDNGGSASSGGSDFNYKEQYGVIVMCKNESEQEAVYNRLTGEGYECKVVAV